MTWNRKSENQLSFWAHGTELRHSYCRFLPTKSAPVWLLKKAEWENVRKVGHPTHQKLTNHNKEIEMIQHQASLRAYALSSWCIFCCDMWLIYLRNLQELALLIRFEPATIQTISLPERVEWRMSGKGRKTQPTQLTQSPASLMPRDLPIQNLEQAIGERMCPKPLWVNDASILRNVVNPVGKVAKKECLVNHVIPLWAVYQAAASYRLSIRECEIASW